MTNRLKHCTEVARKCSVELFCFIDSGGSKGTLGTFPHFHAVFSENLAQIFFHPSPGLAPLSGKEHPSKEKYFALFFEK